MKQPVNQGNKPDVVVEDIQQELSELRQRVAELEALETKHQHMEEPLAQERNLLRTLIDNLPDHIYFKDSNSRFVLVNLAVARHLGAATPDEAIGKTDFDFSPRELAIQYNADERRLFESGQPIISQEEPVFDHYTRTRRLMLTTKIPLRDSQGEIFGLVGINRDITERKEAEEELRHSKQQIQNVLESITDAFFAIDQEGNFTFLNQRAEQILGKPRAELLHKNLWCEFPQLVGSKLYKEYRRAVTEQVTVEFEEYYLPFQAWFKVHAYPYAQGISIYFRDVTERRQAEEMLAQRAAQLALINQIGSKITSFLELDSLLSQAARLIQEIFNYHHVALFLLNKDRAQLKAIAGSYSDYFPANHSQKLSEGIIGWVASHGEKILANDVRTEPRYISLIAERTQTRAELCLPIQMAGRTRGVLDIQSPHLNAFHENDVVAMEILTHQIAVAMENARLYQAVQQELTERKQTEKELQRYWLQLEELVEERTVELKATNKQLKQAQESLRLYADRLKILQEIDRAILAAQSPEDIAQAALYHLQRLVPHIQATVMEFEFDQNKLIVLASHGDDELRLGPDTSLPLTSFGLMEEFQQGWVHEVPDILTLNQSLLALQTLQSSASQSYVNIPLVARGKLIGCLNLGASQPVAFTAEHVAMAREVADQLALAIQQSRLHEQVHHYAVELEQRVAERTARLEEINTELKSFTFSVSHDLRAPLRAVQGFATALQEDYRDQLDTFGQEYLQRIMTAAERMDLLIKDLLTYSRLSRTDLQLKPVSLTAVMADVLTQLEMPLREQQAQITVKDPLPYVKGHYATLVQILVNLLTNAVKFVAPGVRPQVQIWAETRYPDEHKSEPWVRLWVEDNGIGIAPENQERIFQIFERLHGIEAYPGSGVGLAIVRKGVSRIGGHARVESNLGVGSKFWIELPRVG